MQHYCSLRDLMVMPREEFAVATPEDNNDTSDEVKATPPTAEIEVHDNEDKAINQSCARWAGIAKKGQRKLPAPPAMEGAGKHSWLGSALDARCSAAGMKSEKWAHGGKLASSLHACT